MRRTGRRSAEKEDGRRKRRTGGRGGWMRGGEREGKGLRKWETGGEQYEGGGREGRLREQHQLMRYGLKLKMSKVEWDVTLSPGRSRLEKVRLIFFRHSSFTLHAILHKSRSPHFPEL